MMNNVEALRLLVPDRPIGIRAEKARLDQQAPLLLAMSSSMRVGKS